MVLNFKTPLSQNPDFLSTVTDAKVNLDQLYSSSLVQNPTGRRLLLVQITDAVEDPRIYFAKAYLK